MPMAERPAPLREIDWLEIVPALRLARSVRLALETPKLLLAVAGLVLTALGWWLIAQLFWWSAGGELPSGDRLAAKIALYQQWPWQYAAAPSPPDAVGS